jgi:uroporphyrin-III C-methyltransferase
MSKVFLVGAGPGAADLLTLRAARAIGEADVLLADALVSDEVLALAKPNARVLRVGKRGGMKSVAQDFIHRAMVRYARRGFTVARVKGGDPFVFGRGGEEVEALRAAGIEAEVVPGITAGLAVPAAVGIPVTHRAFTHGVTLVTGTAGDGCGEPNWSALAKSGTTLVIYMGLARLLNIAARLIAVGLPPDTPAAAIASGTTAAQRHLVATLAELPARVAAEGLASPVIVVVGQVAALARHGALAGFAARRAA